jgi:hypothetical protein
MPCGSARLVPENLSPPGSTESPGQALRAWGRAHPTLMALKTLLPSYPAERETALPPGLYVDHIRTPWVAVRGEIRVSLARLICVTPNGKHQLVGQVQVTAAENDLHSSIQLRYYLHQPAGVIAREVIGEPEWWMGVLDAHYALGGETIDSAPSGIAA